MRNAVISCQNYNSGNPPITKLHSGIEWIGYKSNNVPNGFMSYFGTTLHVTKEGVYTIYMSADDEGWLYVNGREIGSTSLSSSWHQVSEFKVKLNKGIYGITVSVRNYCPKCPSSSCSNPSSLALFIKDNSGIIVVSTSTKWKVSSSVINYRTLPVIDVALANQVKIQKENILRYENDNNGLNIGSGREIDTASVRSHKSYIMSNINNILPYIEKYIPYIGIGIVAIILLKRRG